MWVANRSFYYRGHIYQTGDTVPAEDWRNRGALIKLKRIRQVEDIPELIPVLAVDPSDLKRDELNSYALEHGIADPLTYSRKEDLLAALEALATKEPDSVVEPGVEPVIEPVIEPVVEPVVEPVIEPAAEPVVESAIEEDLFGTSE